MMRRFTSAIVVILFATSWSLAGTETLTPVLRVTLGAKTKNVFRAVLGQDGNVYLVEIQRERGRLTGPGTLRVFDRSGRKLREFTSPDLILPVVGVDADGTIYYPSFEPTAEGECSLIRVLSPDFRPLGVILTPWTKVERILPTADRLYLIALRGERKEAIDGHLVHVYTKEGRFLTAFARWDERILSLDERINAALYSSVVIDGARHQVVFCRQNEFAPEVYDLDGHLKRRAPNLLQHEADVAVKVRGVYILGDWLLFDVARLDASGRPRTELYLVDPATMDIIRVMDVPGQWGQLVGVDQRGYLYFFSHRQQLELLVAHLSPEPIRPHEGSAPKAEKPVERATKLAGENLMLDDEQEKSPGATGSFPSQGDSRQKEAV